MDIWKKVGEIHGENTIYRFTTIYVSFPFSEASQI